MYYDHDFDVGNSGLSQKRMCMWLNLINLLGTVSRDISLQG